VTATNDLAAQYAGPTGLNTAANYTDATKAFPVDIDNDGTNDFAIQSYLVEKAGAADTYQIGVRVYDYDAVANNTGGAMDKTEASVAMTSSQGERNRRPLSTLYSNVSISEEAESLCNWIDYTHTTGTKEKPAACN
jgi:hypothetical protein